MNDHEEVSCIETVNPKTLTDLRVELQAIYEKMGAVFDELPKVLEAHNDILIADGDLEGSEITRVRHLQVQVMKKLHKSESALFKVRDTVDTLIEMGGDPTQPTGEPQP